MSAEVQEWVAVSYGANGTTVRVSLVDRDAQLSAKWSVKGYPTSIKADVKTARKGAVKALSDLREALAELEEES